MKFLYDCGNFALRRFSKGVQVTNKWSPADTNHLQCFDICMYEGAEPGEQVGTLSDVWTYTLQTEQVRPRYISLLSNLI